MAIEEATHQPERAVAGNCPACGRAVIVFNNHEVWPLVVCTCGWRGGTTEIDNHVRVERQWP